MPPVAEMDIFLLPVVLKGLSSLLEMNGSSLFPGGLSKWRHVTQFGARRVFQMEPITETRVVSCPKGTQLLCSFKKRPRRFACHK